MNEEEAMEIEVNEYVRTRAGHFYKITRIDENGLIYWNKIQCGWSMEQLKDIVSKHSKNIIDLVEAGDYVNGYKVLEVMEDLDTGELNLEMESNCPTPNCNCQLYNKDIKTIVTHEQFASIEYKVEEGK